MKNLFGQHNKTNKGDVFFKYLTAFCAVVIIIVVAGILIKLIMDSRISLKLFGWKFLTSREWNPVIGKFGAAPSIYGTLVSTGIAMLLATPVSLVISLFLVELAPPWLSGMVGSAIELLAAIPSIIFGMWGLFVFAPFMSDYIQPALSSVSGSLPLFKGPPMGIGMLTAGIILAIMILPFITAVTRDVFMMVPKTVKEAAHGMGATTWEVTKKVTLKYSIHGIVGALFLGLGRAIGETMAITFVIGNEHRISSSLFSPATSIASTLANEFSEADNPTYLSSLIELGLVLFVITFLFQIVAHFWLKRIKTNTGARV